MIDHRMKDKDIGLILRLLDIDNGPYKSVKANMSIYLFSSLFLFIIPLYFSGCMHLRRRWMKKSDLLCLPVLKWFIFVYTY